MIVITGKPGQLGNSLILYASFIAFGIEQKVKIYNPSFYKYKAYFDFTKEHIYSRLSFTFLYYFTRLLIKAKFKNVKELGWEESVDLDNALEIGNIRNTLYLQGWQYRGNDILKKHKQKIVDLFKPKRQYISQLDSFFASHNNFDSRIIIGVHIRRGDYRFFENGKYFYSIEDYILKMKEVSELFNTSKILFLVCSNETLDESAFAGIKGMVTQGPGHELLDLYSFARCHYLLGPPSTYTMWASFYGNVPLCMLHAIDKTISVSDFKIQEHF